MRLYSTYGLRGDGAKQEVSAKFYSAVFFLVVICQVGVMKIKSESTQATLWPVRG
jgi:hypothetical protein